MQQDRPIVVPAESVPDHPPPSPELVLDYRAREQFFGFHKRAARFACIVAHRRAGKTVACINELQHAAIACARLRGRFAYLSPYLKQSKTVAWDYLRGAVAPFLDKGARVHESELRVDYPGGGQVRLYGADNPDALRGIYLDGVVLDEYADMDARVWAEIIRPALADRDLVRASDRPRAPHHRLLRGLRRRSRPLRARARRETLRLCRRHRAARRAGKRARHRQKPARGLGAARAEKYYARAHAPHRGRHQRGARVHPEMLVRRAKMRARHRRAETLPRRRRREARRSFWRPAAQAASGARLELARGGFVSLSRAHARPPGDAFGLPPPHRVRAARLGVSVGECDQRSFDAGRVVGARHCRA